MSTPPAYSQIPPPPEAGNGSGGAITLNDSPPSRRKSLDEVSDTSDIVVYRDNLEVEPFDEKDKRFTETSRMEYGPDDDEEEEGYVVEPRRLRPRKKSRKVLAALIAIVSFAAIVGGLSAFSYSAPSYASTNGNRQITMDHIFNGTFAPKSQQIAWVKGAPDGTFSTIDTNGDILLAHVTNMTSTRVLVEASKVRDSEGKQIRWTSWQLSADGQYVLFAADTVKQWRRSSWSNFYVHRISDDKTFAIQTPSYPPTVLIAKWAPVGHALAFVDKNDLYVIPHDEISTAKPVATRVTTDGSPTVFNGVPDWVYEEEIYESDYTTWWSLDGKSLAYLRFDETAVHEWKMMYYNPNNNAYHVDQYLKEVDIRYPKPGTPNPLASVHTFSMDTLQTTGSASKAKAELSWDGALPLDQRIITQVEWVSNDHLLVRETDRAQRKGSIVIFDKGLSHGKIVRRLGKNGEQGDDGWIDYSKNIIPVGSPVNGYLDIAPKDGFNHVALFSPVDSTTPIWLTQGDLFEVMSIASANALSGLVYCIISTAGLGAIERRLLTVPIVAKTASSGPIALPTSVDLLDLRPGRRVSASFSPNGQYYVETNDGPEVPSQRILEVGAGKSGLDILLEDNKALNATLAEFVKPVNSYSEFTNSEGLKFNMVEMLPPNMDTSGRKKYPVLFMVYGGPYVQVVSNGYYVDWMTYLAATKKYIIVSVDGRGTGGKGRALRNPVTDNLGHYEVIDQVAVAREMAKRPYVDHDKIGIYGWSYGGYMTCKTVEAGSGVFKLGMAIAPVTDWNFYDSMYTERYMNTPEANPEGYKHSSVQNVTNFQGVDFLLGHGSGDDNVHFQNSASLIDKFTQEGIRGWRFRMFTDSDHSIRTRHANREVFQWMVDFLDEKWGRGGTVRHS